MNFLQKVKKNEVKFGLENYVFLLRGIPKSGKSSFYAKLIEDMYGDSSKGLLIPFEKGYSAINGVNVFPYTITPELVIDDETFTGWEVFTSLVDELCALPAEEKPKIIAIDTIDEFVSVASEEVCRLSRLKTKKPCDSIDAAFGGFARGKKLLASMVKEQIEKLRGANIGIFFIGHTKLKTLKTKIDEQEYQVLGSNLTEDYDRIFANDADFILIIEEDNQIVNGKMVTGERYLRFRGDGFYSAGSRFPNVPEKTPLDTKEFINVLKKAVMEISGIKTESEYSKAVDQENKMRTEEVKHNKEVQEKTAIDLVEKIKAFGKAANTTVAMELKQALVDNEIDLKNPIKNKITALQEIVTRFNI